MSMNICQQRQKFQVKRNILWDKKRLQISVAPIGELLLIAPIIILDYIGIPRYLTKQKTAPGEKQNIITLFIIIHVIQ